MSRLNEFNSPEYNVLKCIFCKDLAVLIENYVYCYVKLCPTGSDKVVSEFPIRFAQRHGICKEYHSNGNLKCQLGFHLGQKHGECCMFDQYGVLSSRMNFQNDKLHGEYTEFKYNGQVLVSGWYLNGQRHGKRQEFFAGYIEQYLHIECNYYNGTLHGEYIEYIDPEKHPRDYREVKEKSQELTGSTDRDRDLECKKPVLSVTQTYIMGKLTGLQTKYHSNGKLQSKIEYHNNDYHGNYSEWNSEGYIIKDFNYRMGKLHGIQREYDSKGRIQSQNSYNEDVQHGEANEYTSDGKFKLKCFYDKGALHGPYDSLYEGFKTTSGGDSSKNKLIINGTYLDGKRHGVYTETRYWETGSSEMQSYYSMGKLQGKQLKYVSGSDGVRVLREESNYENDQLHGLQTKYHENMQVYVKQYFRKGQLHGEYIEYFQTNVGEPVIRKKENYVHGHRHGEYIMNWPSGQLKSLKTYENDKPIGEYIEYTEKGVVSEQGVYTLVSDDLHVRSDLSRAVPTVKHITFSLYESTKNKKNIL
jgi:antitoxin component YwqK of YwqJK toxin-antitoxin module